MVSHKTLLITLLGAGCLAAAGVGGYFAARDGSVPQPAVSAAPPVATSEPRQATAAAKTERPSASAAGARVPEVVAPSSKGNQTSNRMPAEPVIPPATEATAAATAHAEASSTATAFPSQTPSAAAPQSAAAAPSPEPAEPPAAAAEPPARHTTREELIIPKESVIGIRLETPVSSETAKVEDRVTARVIRDVVVDGVPVVPAGARLEGAVTLVERGGRVQGQARIGIRFTSVVLSSDVKLPIQTETIFRTGEAPGNEAASKVGAAAVAGTILGAIFGGGKGAAIGGAVGAAGGTATVMAGNRNAATIAAGTELTVRLAGPLTVTVERDDQAR